MTTLLNNANHVPIRLGDDASLKFFNNENGRKFVVEIAKLKDHNDKKVTNSKTTKPR